MTGRGELFLSQVREAKSRNNFGVLETPMYFDPQMSRNEANRADWGEFKERMRPMGTVALRNSNAECLITPKAVPWGMEDVNIFAGEEGREIYEIDDLEAHEGESFLNVNFTIAEALLSEGHDGVQITIGFNRDDLSVGHHSVLKLHSHIRVAPSAIDIGRRELRPWHSLDRFDKLAFIEPFAPLSHDYIEHAVKEGILERFLTDAPRAGLGYTSLSLKRSPDLPGMFGDLKSLYGNMKLEYENVADIFTDKSIDPSTERYIPRRIEDRILRFEHFISSRAGLYSSQSIGILDYLVKHIQSAMPRASDKPTDMSSSAMMYLSRGFAGAIVYSFNKHSDVVRLDLLPRVITTSPPTKTMMGEDMPTVIARTDKPATSEDARIVDMYNQKIRRIVQNISF